MNPTVTRLTSSSAGTAASPALHSIELWSCDTASFGRRETSRPQQSTSAWLRCTGSPKPGRVLSGGVLGCRRSAHVHVPHHYSRCHRPTGAAGFCAHRHRSWFDTDHLTGIPLTNLSVNPARTQVRHCSSAARRYNSCGYSGWRQKPKVSRPLRTWFQSSLSVSGR